MSLECQSWRDSIFRYIAFVINLQILPNTKLFDIIKPATEASFGQLQSSYISYDRPVPQSRLVT